MSHLASRLSKSIEPVYFFTNSETGSLNRPDQVLLSFIVCLFRFRIRKPFKMGIIRQAVPLFAVPDFRNLGVVAKILASSLLLMLIEPLFVITHNQQG